MTVRLFAALALAAVVGCDEGPDPRGEPSARSDADGASPAPAAPAPAPGGRQGAERRASGRRGDRHARLAARRSPSVKRVEGTLARAGERAVVIRPPGAPELTLRVGPGTTVTVDGRPSRLEALPEGAPVRASYETGSGGRPTAIVIEARGRPAPGGDATRRTSPAPGAASGG